MRKIDIVIVLSYLLLSAVIPVIVSKRQKSKDDFMLAGQRIHWLPLSISSVAAGFSAISLLGAPGFVMAQDMKYLPTLFMGLLSVPVVFWIVVPFLYKLKLVSLYEYLESRFCPFLRYAASVLFMVSKLGYLSLAIFTPALALSSITGYSVYVFIVILGLVTALYTMVGGLEGVIWCDVMQYIVMIIGIGGAVVFFLMGDTAAYWDTAVAAGKTKMFDFDFRLDNLSIWVMFINCTLIGVASTCSDQTTIQRLSTARSLKDSMIGYLFSMIFGTPIVLILYFIGAWMYGFYQIDTPLPPELANSPDKAFPYLIGYHLPVGVSGLLLAAVLAAGMSTIGAVIHSLTSLFMVDVYEQLFCDLTKGKKYVSISRVVAIGWTCLAIGLAFFVMHVGNTIIEISQIIGSLVSAPLGGIFMLGIFTRRTTASGAICGGIVGLITTVLVWYLDKAKIVGINFMRIAVFGVVATFTVGFLVGVLENSIRNSRKSD